MKTPTPFHPNGVLSSKLVLFFPFSIKYYCP
nr:MAG TPA: hypothetical protein [Bacteriophage sp.]